MTRERGVVRSWLGSYGFITPDAAGGSLFAHFTAIIMSGFRALEPGWTVEFEREQQPNGKWRAVNVVRVTPEDERNGDLAEWDGT